MIKPKKLIKELKKQLRRDKDNLALRLQLAALYRDAGEMAEAVDTCYGIAVTYFEKNLLAQANTMCRNVLAMDPRHSETRALHAKVELALLEELRHTEVDKDAAAGNWVPSLAAPRPPTGVDATRGKILAGRVGARVPEPVQDRGSMSLMSPTPLPAPLAPHEADDDDDDSLERYKLPIRQDLSGSVPVLSLPGDLMAMDDDEVVTGEEERTTSQRVGKDSQRSRRARRSSIRDVTGEARDYGDDDEPTQLTARRRQMDSELLARKGSAEGERGVTTTDRSLRVSQLPGVRAEFSEVREPSERVSTLEKRFSADSLEVRTTTRNMGQGGRVASEWTGDTTAPRGSVRDSGGVPRELGDLGEPVDGRPEPIALEVDRTVRVPADILQQGFAGGEGIHDDMELAAALSMLSDDDSQSTRTPLAVLADLPSDAMNDLMARMTLRNYQPGQYIVREADRCDSCFALVSGDASVLRRDPLRPESEPVEVMRLKDGEFFGEHALLPNRRRQMSVRAEAECHVYEIPRLLLRELAATYGPVGPLLGDIYRRRLMHGVVSACPYTRDMSRDRQRALAERFRPIQCKSGERIIHEGRAAGGLYVVVLGAVEVVKRLSPRRSVVLATLGEGAYFGEMAFADSGTAKITVIAGEATEVALLPADDFAKIIAESPGLWRRIKALGSRRELEQNLLCTGESFLV